MKRINICLLVVFCMAHIVYGQGPEIILNDLFVSNAYKTSAIIDSVYYFVGHDGDYDIELWRTNGTPEGTYRVSDIHPAGSSYPGEFTRVGDALYFMAANNEGSEKLFISDGTAEGTHWVYNVDPESKEQYHLLTASGGFLYFRTSRPEVFTELWVSDGTTENTHMVADICENEISYPHELNDFNGSLVFLAEDCEVSGSTIYMTQGLNGTVVQLGGDHVREMLVTDDHLYFVSNFEDFGGELSASAGGISDITMVSDIYPGEQGSDVYHLTQVDSLIFFRALDPNHGAELWSYSPNSATVKLVKDIYPGSNNNSFPSQLINFHGLLIFSANDGVHGEEPWVSDGTEEGTFMLKNINEEPGEVAYHSYPQKFFATHEQLYFMADDGIHGAELWQTDGTPDGTKMTADIWPRGNEGSDPGSFGQAGDYIVFNAWYNKRTLFSLNLDQGAPVGVKEMKSGTLLFIHYPNPAHSNLFIEPTTSNSFQYKVLDIAGREIINDWVRNGEKTSPDLSLLKPGVYFIHAEYGNAYQVEKLIIE